MKDDFKYLGIGENILSIIGKEGFKRSKEIQFKTMPLIFAGDDVIATSPIGSGKTISYIISFLNIVVPQAGLQGLIIVPTEEHAKEVEKNFKLFTKQSTKCLNVFNSCKKAILKEKIIKVDVVISTPKRLKELINEKNYDFSKVTTIVLDDVDVMFEVEDFDRFNFILRNMPKKKQMLIFSTSISQGVYLKIRYWMRMPKRINI